MTFKPSCEPPSSKESWDKMMYIHIIRPSGDEFAFALDTNGDLVFDSVKGRKVADWFAPKKAAGHLKDDNLVVWKAKTHMRDFEVLAPFSDAEVRVARGQGIGVLLIPGQRRYIKIIEDDSEHACGLSFPVCGALDTDDEYRETVYPLVSADLALGYEVLVLSKDDDNKILQTSLVEDEDERDEKETPIFAPGVSKDLAAYKPSKRKPASQTENKDNQLKKIKT